MVAVMVCLWKDAVFSAGATGASISLLQDTAKMPKNAREAIRILFMIFILCKLYIKTTG